MQPSSTLASTSSMTLLTASISSSTLPPRPAVEKSSEQPTYTGLSVRLARILATLVAVSIEFSRTYSGVDSGAGCVV